jgi:hypothetical protein
MEAARSYLEKQHGKEVVMLLGGLRCGRCQIWAGFLGGGGLCSREPKTPTVT